MNDLSDIQRDILYIAVGIGSPKGLAIKEKLSEYYDKQVNHGRLYPNLDKLVEKGYIEKGQRDRRTNEYAVTDKGLQAISNRRAWENELVKSALRN